MTDVDAMVVGLRREAEILSVALEQGCHTVLEGPPGTGKSTLLRSIAAASGRGVQFVEGNAELTPARLIGAHDPALVLDGGYTPEAWTDGPLLGAMRAGELLYLEELNRIPEETLNVLITAMAEREVVVPRLGRIAAADGFVLVAAMNPFDAIGTARVSQSIADRMCRIAIGYLDEQQEREVVPPDGRRGRPWRSRSRSRAPPAPIPRCASAHRSAARSTWSASPTGSRPCATSRRPSAGSCSTPRSPRCQAGSGSTRIRAAPPRR